MDRYDDVYENGDYQYPSTVSYEEEKEENKRSFIDRLFAPITNESVTTAIYNATDNDPTTTIGEGIIDGFTRMNPFKDDVSDSKTFSDVLSDNMNVNPDNPVGKVAKGVAGFAGDVLLDPMTYLTGGLAAIPTITKGSGTVVKGSSKIDEVQKSIDSMNDTATQVGKVKMMSMDDALRIVDDPVEAEKLRDSFNSKVMKTYSDEMIKKEGGLSVGFQNIPFANKIQIGDKTLADFQKELLSSEQLRKLGDNTIAPITNKIFKDVRTSQLGSKFSKYASAENEFEKDPTVAGGLYYIVNRINNKDSALARYNESTYDSYENIIDVFGGFDEAQNLRMLNSIENGDARDAIDAIDSIRKIREKGYAVEGMDDIVKAMKGEDEQFKKNVNNLLNRRKSELTYLDANQFRERHALKTELDEVLKGTSRMYDPKIMDNAEYDKLLEMDKEAITKLEERIEVYNRQERLNKEKNKPSIVVESTSARTPEELSELYDFMIDDEAMNAAKLWNDSMRDIAKKEVDRGLLSPNAARLRDGTYVPHVLTDEAREKYVDRLPEELLQGGYEEGFISPTGVKKRRLDGNISDINKSFSEGKIEGLEEVLTPKLFEENFAKVFLNRSVGSNRMIVQGENMDVLKNKVLQREASEAYPTKVMEYNDINKTINRHINVMAKEKGYNLSGNEKQEIRKKLYQHLGIDNMMSSNMPLLDKDDAVANLEDTLNGIRNIGSGLPVDKSVAYISELNKLIDPSRTIEDPRTFINNLYKKNSKGEVINDPSLTTYFTNKNITEEINKMSYVQNQQATSDFINFTDMLTQRYKKMKTIWNPGFIPQNVVGNNVNAWLANAATLSDPKIQKKAYDIMRTKDPRAKVTLNGKEYSYEQISMMADDYGVTKNTFTTDIEKDLNEPNNPFLRGLHNVENKMIDASSAVESHGRLSLFMNEVNSGKTPQEAADSVKRFLFDYDDITKTESEVMKRVIPFYVFMRKNSELQLKELFNQTYKYAMVDKALNSADEALIDDDRDLYDESSRIAITENYAVNPNLPTDQLEKISTPRKILNQSSPFVKLPIEAATGQSIYNGDELEGSDWADRVAGLGPQVLTMGHQAATVEDRDAVDRLMYLLGQGMGQPISGY